METLKKSRPNVEPEKPPSLAVPQQELAFVPGVNQALAELQAAEWNAFNESIGSFADQHSTL